MRGFRVGSLSETGHHRGYSSLDVRPVDLVGVKDAQGSGLDHRKTSENSGRRQTARGAFGSAKPVLFTMIEKPEAMAFHEFVALRQLQIFAHHFADELGESCFWYPTQFEPGLGCVTEQRLDLGRPKISRIDRDDAFPGF